MESVDDKFKRLLRVVLDGSCTDDDRLELEQIVLEHPRLKQAAVKEIYIHSLLQWHDVSIVHDLPPVAVAEDDGSSTPHSPTSTTSGGTRAILRWGVLAAACAFVATALLLWRHWPDEITEAPGIAQIVDSQDVAWSDESNALQPGGRVKAGRLQTSGGAFTLKFRTGPMVQFVGPTSLVVMSDMLVEMERGQATAEVPESGIGFTITTPLADIVDQGTKFGVAIADGGDTDVIVFEGNVDLQNKARRGERQQRLVQGEAVRIDRDGAVDRLMQVRRDTQGGWWTLDHPEPADSAIMEVRDNIPPSDGSKYFCYQITYRGLDDDVYAYADQPAQWNGLTAKGLPEFLRGADFVKTFNDYRYMLDFKMVVQLSRPANLYVFTDDRVPPPEWLKSQFEDTGVSVGLDEGPWVNVADEFMKDAPDRAIDVGGGNSIDLVFSVWRRRCDDTSPVTLGDVGPHGSEGAQGRAMYGIAATPLD